MFFVLLVLSVYSFSDLITASVLFLYNLDIVLVP
jgi:hypothetical protein